MEKIHKDLLPLKLAGDQRGIPKGQMLDQGQQIETYPTVTSAKAPFYLQTFTDGRRPEGVGKMELACFLSKVLCILGKGREDLRVRFM